MATLRVIGYISLRWELHTLVKVKKNRGEGWSCILVEYPWLTSEILQYRQQILYGKRQNLSKVFSAVRWLKAYSYSSLTLSITHSFTDDSVLTWESLCLGPAILGFSNRFSRANASSLYTLLFYNLKKLTSIGGINGKAKFKKAIYRKWKLPWMAQGIINELSLFLVCTPESLISKEYALLLFTRCLSLSASDMFPLTMCASLLVIT